ncbi:hypothetical protein RFI_03278, partial [Reticulomyxa filosa]
QKHLTENLGSILNTPLIMLGRNTAQNDLAFKIGDRIQLAEGGTGTVKYIGSDEDSKEIEPIVGVELDTWDPNANDGIFKGKELFQVKMGRGLFTRRQSILQVLPDKPNDTRHLKDMPKIGNRVKLHSGEEAVVDSIGDDITVTLLFSSTRSDIRRTVKLTDLSENLGKFYDKQYTVLPNKHLELIVGDHVRLIRGKTGKIKYIGRVGNEGEMIGLEMDSWTPSGHTGKGYFIAPNGRGHFAKRSDIVEIIKPPEKSEQAKLQIQRHRQMLNLQNKVYKIEQLEKKQRLGMDLDSEQNQFVQRKTLLQRQLKDLTEAFNQNYPFVEIDEVVKREASAGSNGYGSLVIQESLSVNTGDRVVLDSGDIGKVIFIGSVSFDNRQMLGILLDEWSPNGHDGTVDGTQYFEAPEGRGLLVPFDSVVGLYDEYGEVQKAAPKKKIKKNDQKRGSVELKPVMEEEDDDDDEDYKNESERQSIITKIFEGDKTVYPDLPKVGEKVNVGGVCVGRKKKKKKELSYTILSKEEPMIGIELETWSANATDGSFMGTKYFESAPGKGYFLRKDSYASLNDMMNNSKAKSILQQGSLALENFDSKALGVYFEEDDHVVTSEGHSGKVAFIGKVKFSTKEMVGLLLDEWDPNGHNGRVRGEKYFDALDGFGWFVPVDCVIEKITDDEEWKNKREETQRQKSKNKYRPKIEIGQRVQIKGGLRGLVRFYGKTAFDDSKWVGLELDNWHYNAHDGTVDGNNYFTANKGRGFFVRPENISVVLRREDEKKDVESLTVMPEIGDRVRTVRGKTGIVRFIGPVSFSSGVLIGLELDRWSANGNNGSVDDSPYFSCPLGRGCFTSLSHLIENLGSTLPTQSESNENDSKTSTENSKQDSSSLRLGDKVQLPQGKVGTVRFIGTTEATGNDEIIGFEFVLLESWDANATDGSLGGKRLFEAQNGRGYFTRRKSIADVVRPQIKKDGYAKLKGLQSMVNFNGRVVKLIEYVPEKQRWKVRLIGGKKKDKKSLGVKEENLTPTLDWEILPALGSSSTHLTRAPMIGDRVRTKNGKTGIVRFVGEAEFAKNQITIGLELDEWSPSAHNGTLDKEYFKCKEGHGYFTSLENLIANLGQFDENQPNAPPLQKSEFRVGDKVRLARGKIGEVKFIGVTDFSKGEEIVGLELSQWTQGAHDGKVSGKEYFKTKKGRGYFTRKASVASIVLSDAVLNSEKNADNDDTNNNNNDKKGVSKARIRREANKMKSKIHQILVLEMREAKGEKLTPYQIDEIKQKAKYLQRLNDLENGNIDLEAEDREKKEQDKKKRKHLLERKATMDLTAKKWKVPVKVDDLVKLENGDTGVVKWIGKVAFLPDDIIGLLMDQSNPNYHTGELEGKEYFKAPNHRGYFALAEEIEENMGTTKRSRRRKSVNLTEENKSEKNVKIGDVVQTAEGSGKVVWMGTVTAGDEEKTNEEMLGVELESFSANANDGSVEGTKYFDSKQGRGMFVRTQSVQLDLNSDFAKSQLENAVMPGDRVRTDRGYTGVLKLY